MTNFSVSARESTSSLRALFNPGSIALVGATDKSGWSRNTFDNLQAHGFTGPVHLVNPRTEIVHGRRAHRSLSEIGQPVDLAYVMVPTPVVLPVLREGARLGIRSYVVLTAGFGETGAEGRLREQEVLDFARENELTVLGPNGNGYINAAARITPYGLPILSAPARGSVGVVLQSGALASSILAFAQARNVGISLLTAMGNEAMISVTDVMEYLIDDPATKVIALFLESVRRPGEFAAAARRAAAAGKPVVALKIGASQLASRTAQAHTGALVGDDSVIDAAFRQLGVIRVRSLEDLIITSGLLAGTPPLPGRRVGVVTPSGGASEIIADRAEQEGLVLPEYAPETVARLKEILPEFATVQNPLDVTGYVVVDRTLLSRALAIVAEDPGIDEVMLLSDLPRGVPADPELALSVYHTSSRLIQESPRPVVVVSNVLVDVSDFGRKVQEETGYPYVAGGIEHGVGALGAAVRWAEQAREVSSRAPAPVTAVPELPAGPTGTWVEHEAAAFLARNGIPVVPAELADDEDTAVEAADRFGYPVVLKAVADGLGHKSDIGGVRLGLASEQDVRQAHREITASLRAMDAKGIGTLVQPQRSGGVELLVGVVRDAAWGPVLAVGLGGIWVEVLRDAAQRLLPVSTADVRSALGELRGAVVLRGSRGHEPADLDSVAEVVARVGELALALGDQLESLEINPLLVRGSRVEALDALITWR
ncbi:acetate--CoA ligase family protein [Amycolatopsis acidiphila]|uniref:Acetate--CoA ligase family protein n=1 Tax=Amycolatopsis acidiphila TaxID=715473 RepID=A0A558A1H1_9PSEU|nr:acetate--CoA ligase family protein [Amycolatopsis acidiphila]TVT18109.1 acetate--CoA ligase family protein [Amycolatopsis acidiphila]UIJ61917.1 acetate--CoA ligase family protein [Amycolatopsis acidiphila]GHG57169.1 pimeloyl-CoA synthetase [Amycolatopsis acidiphila]